jgi:hypothetical protein
MTLCLTLWLGRVGCAGRVTPYTLGGQAGAVVGRTEVESPPSDSAHP